MGKIVEKIKVPFEIVKIIGEYEPSYFIFFTPQIVINAFLTILYVYFPKLIIEQLVNSKSYSLVLTVILQYIGILVISNIINVILKNKSNLHATIFSAKLKKKIGQFSMHIELEDIEDPQMRDVINLASRATELTKTMKTIESIITDVLAILGLAWIIVRLDYLFVLVVLAILAVKTVFVQADYRYTKKIRRQEAKNNRLGDYLNHIAYFNEGAEKEIRLNNLQDWYMEKISGYRETMLRINYRGYRRSAIYNILMMVLVSIQSFLVLWILSKRYLANVITIADFTMYFSAITTISAKLSSISDRIGKYNQQALNLIEYKKLLTTAKITDSASTDIGSEFSTPTKVQIIFHDVSFSYPNTSKIVLDHINLTISNREKLVIVGANGSGKSTFIKLLCKFYRPTFGTITLNGTDIWDIPNDKYFQIISAVFQDFKNFAFTVKENIAMCEDGDMVLVKSAMNLAGLSECIEKLPNKLDTYLTRQFDTEGIELSGGQAQKLAIARAIYKNSPILILDEPTSNLDPKAESEIYLDLFNTAKEKTTIFISHRLAASSIADNIAVFDNGKIVEYGTHTFLMAQNTYYAEMYRKQSSEYVEK